MNLFCQEKNLFSKMAKYLKQSGHTYREKEREIDGIQCSNNNETSDKG